MCVGAVSTVCSVRKYRDAADGTQMVMIVMLKDEWTMRHDQRSKSILSFKKPYTSRFRKLPRKRNQT